MITTYEELVHLYMKNLESKDDEVPEFLKKITEGKNVRKTSAGPPGQGGALSKARKVHQREGSQTQRDKTAKRKQVIAEN